jgi:hypothetical protein
VAHIKVSMVNKDHGNAGSCKQYVDYLEKENEGKSITEREYFFNDKSNFIAAQKAQDLIDNSPKQGIRGKDAKYFEIIMSFDTDELRGKSNQDIKDFVKESFPKIYAESVKGKTVDPDQLIWVAKLEQERKYKSTNPETKSGNKKKGELKEGDQRHVHIIIARKTSDNKMSISPLNTFKKESTGVIKSGFEKNHLRQAFETALDKKWNYDRPFEKTFKYQNTMKHGTAEEKKEVQQILNNFKGKEIGAHTIQEVQQAPRQEKKQEPEKKKNRVYEFLSNIIHSLLHRSRDKSKQQEQPKQQEPTKQQEPPKQQEQKQAMTISYQQAPDEKDKEQHPSRQQEQEHRQEPAINIGNQQQTPGIEEEEEETQRKKKRGFTR